MTACIDQTFILRISGLSPLAILLLKYGIKYLAKSKKHASLQFLKVKLKNGSQRLALVDLAKHMWDKWVLCNPNPSITFPWCKPLIKNTNY